MSEFAISAFTTLIVTLDPIGLIPLFLSLTSHMSQTERRRTALWATGIAAAIMIGFALVGARLLEQLGISLSAFRIAGGLMLFFTAFEMVFGQRQPMRSPGSIEETETSDARAIAAFPLAVPLLAGPGSITVCILLSGKAGTTIFNQAVLVGVILVACTLSLGLFLAAEPVDRLLGKTGKTVFTRLLGVLLAALAVQFVTDGLVEILKEVR